MRFSVPATACAALTILVLSCGDAAVEPTPPAAPVATTLTVTPAAAELGALGATTRLSAEVRDQNGQLMPGATVAWSSSNASVATVDASGLVTAVASGSATIMATAGSASGTAVVTVAQVVHEGDRAALVAFFEATDGPNWIDNENWLTDAPLGEWYGVETDQSGRVIGLDLAGHTRLGDRGRAEFVFHGLAGSIPPEIGNLTHLTHLDLELNRLTGPIPAELGSLSSLEDLYLDNNNLTGPIPTELGNLARLQRVNLSFNRLTGPIPAELGNLGFLESLELGPRNYLTGPIPPELGNLVRLEVLWIDSNLLSGPIPAELGNLSNLRALGLANNRLTGSIPAELGDLSSLRNLQLRINGLTGSIPAELGGLGRLQSLDVSSNRLTGTIPHAFLELDGLATVSFDGNASLCARGIADFVGWLNGIDEVSGPYCNESDMQVLERLYEASTGPRWTNSAEWLQSPVLDEWHGVSADDFGRVVTLDLTRNGLTGELPADLGSLAEMTALRMGGNDLSGRLPQSLTRLALAELHYSNTGLCAPADATFRTWLSGIASHDGTGVACAGLSDREILETLYGATHGPNWTSSDNWLTDAPLADWYGVETDDSGRVTHLRLWRNRLSSSIPPELGGLSRLQLLWLHNNDLSGPIPTEFGNLASLEQLTLSGNSLTGPIPPELGRLSRLVVLKLNGNALTGPIPPEPRRYDHISLCHNRLV